MAYDAADAVRCILDGGLTAGSLIMILNDWVGGEDAFLMDGRLLVEIVRA
jgi:hypothetical protein